MYAGIELNAGAGFALTITPIGEMNTMGQQKLTLGDNQGCPMGYPYGSVKIFPRSKLHIRMQIKIIINLAIY